jgi:two-component system phosphate regulon sensor histidine kinase PhoR
MPLSNKCKQNPTYCLLLKYSLPNSGVIVSVKIHHGMVRIRVKDTGIGIPAESISKVTKGFYRAENAIKATSGGTGLGLYLVRTIVGLHGGKLKIESELHKGTQIIIDLPLSV